MRHPWACSKKETADVAGSSPSATKVGDRSIDTDPLAALKLSDSLSPAVPDSVASKGEGVTPGQLAVSMLTSAERKKSQEACYIRQKIKEAKANQEMMAMQLCQIEAQKGMKAGGKYKMSFSTGGAALTQNPPPGVDPTAGIPQGGDPTAPGPVPGGDPSTPPGGAEGPGGPGGGMNMAIFLDNSVEGKFSVYVCQDDKLSQKIVVDSAGEAGAKGSFKSVIEMDGMSAQMQGAFDNGVGVAGHQRSSSLMTFSMQSNYFRTSTELDLVQDGISKVKTASEMASGTEDFSSAMKEIGTAYIGPNLGTALFQRTLNNSLQQPTAPKLTEAQAVTTRSYFDSAGLTLSSDESDSFKEGGALAIPESDLPKLIPADFKVEFEATDWDCSGAEEFTVDADSAAFMACTEKFASQFSQETCGDPAFAAGPEATDVPVVIDSRSSEEIPELPLPPEGEIPPAP